MFKQISADEAIRLVKDGATVLVNPVPTEEVFQAFGRCFEETAHPRDLTVVWSAGIGPLSEERRGMNNFAYPGMLRRAVGGHYGLNYALVKMVAANQCEAYNLPQGTMTQLYREIAAGRPGLVTDVGLGTFVDPRIEGGKMNDRAREAEDLVSVVQLNGHETLFYKSFSVDVGIVRGTTVDPEGNITVEDEAIPMDNLEVAMATKNSGGIVIVQVEKTSDTPAVPQDVAIPGVLIDYVVVAKSRATHPHTLFVEYDPALSGRSRVSLADEVELLPLNTEKTIARRVAMALEPGMNVNLGFGMPMGVASVAFEEGLLEQLSLNTEVGVFGGLPERGQNFGPAKNPSAFVSQAQMFDFYDGGGLDLTCVGLAQVDQAGNVNVSKIGPRVVGCGGFINLTQAAKRVMFCGEFVAGGLDVAIREGRPVIQQEGKVPKFVESVQQITFSGEFARIHHRDVTFVTERCVFKLADEGLVLSEIAPGIDIQKDILDKMGFTPIVPDDVAPMSPTIFQEAAMGLASAE